MRTVAERSLAACCLVLAVAVAGCDECSDSEDCPEGESCLYTQGEMQCVVPCQDDDDCPDGQTCSGSGNSCSGCEDYVTVCR
jgi:hypothetical protein